MSYTTADYKKGLEGIMSSTKKEWLLIQSKEKKSFLLKKHMVAVKDLDRYTKDVKDKRSINAINSAKDTHLSHLFKFLKENENDSAQYINQLIRFVRNA